ncbi:MAG TPA: alpha/beta fold hydrolase [Gemmatimonadaceae bacterium]|nr:alpha/beta fold hydrolase [Gemmatimonadaceae bacterium]
MNRTSRIVAGVVGFALVAIMWPQRREKVASQGRQCLGGRLGVEGRQMAYEQGLEVDAKRDCILEPILDQKAAAAPVPSRPAEPAASGQTLAEARRGFVTAVRAADGTYPLPSPPPNLFVPIPLTNNRGAALPAFVTPDPRDGRRHPAIVWITGGNSSALGDFWTADAESDDESVSAFRKAGVVVMFPSLRGGHVGTGGREYFLGETDDVLAAAEQLARLPYVDSDRIYLGGHSTGGTLALLVAETSERFRGVFAFGPVARVDRYPTPMVPAELAGLPEPERRLRSPIYWLHGITTPTYVIEGRASPNIGDAKELCAASPRVTCLLMEGADHFDVLSRVTRVVAARMSIGQDVERGLRTDDFPAGTGRQ